MNRLGQLRIDRGLTLLGLSARSGVDRTTIHAIERYGHKPRPETRAKLALALNVPEGEIWPEARTATGANQ
jgi:transcriptional regulator with XRE-family HTH domain